MQEEKSANDNAAISGPGAVSRQLPFGVWVAVGVATLLRLAALGQKTLWCDELVAVQRLGLGFVRHLMAMRGNHPLYELLLRVWASPDSGDVWLRIPSAVLGILAVWMTWRLLRNLGRREALVAAWLVALSPLHVMYSRIARAYSLAFTLALASNLALIWTLKRRKLLPFAAYVLATMAMVYSNLVAGSVWIAQGCFILWFFRRRLRRLMPWIAANVCIAALLLPWGVYSFVGAMQWGSDTQYTAQQQGRLAKVAYQAMTFCLGETVNPLNWWVVPISALAFGSMIVAGVVIVLRRRRPMAVFLLLQAVIVYGMGLYFGAAAAKHLAVLLPAWFGVIAIGIVRTRVRWVKVAALTVMLTAMIVSNVNYFTGWEFADADMVTPWREMVKAVRAESGPGDAVIIGYQMDRGAYDMFNRYDDGEIETEYLDFKNWRSHLDKAMQEHKHILLLLHDGDPWEEIETWLRGQNIFFEMQPFQEEEHTLERIRARDFFGPGERFQSPLYRLYRITPTVSMEDE